MSQHVHITPPRKPGKPAHPEFRCCRCAKSTRKEKNFVICSMSNEIGGRLCENCAQLLNIDYSEIHDCQKWAMITYACSKCMKVDDELYTCACCETDVCYSCCTDWTINLFYGKQIDTIICTKCFPEIFFNDEAGNPLVEFLSTRMSVGDRILGYCRACDMFHDTFQKTIDDFCPLETKDIPPMVNKIRKFHNKIPLRQSHSYNPNKFGHYVSIKRNLQDDNDSVSSVAESSDTLLKIKHFFESQKDNDSTSIIRASPPLINNQVSNPINKKTFESTFKPEQPNEQEISNIIETAVSISMSKRFDHLDARFNDLNSKFDGLKLSMRPHPASTLPYKNSHGLWIQDTSCQTPRNDNPLTNFFPNSQENQIDSKSIENFINSFNYTMETIRNFSSQNNHPQFNQNFNKNFSNRSPQNHNNNSQTPTQNNDRFANRNRNNNQNFSQNYKRSNKFNRF